MTLELRVDEIDDPGDLTSLIPEHGGVAWLHGTGGGATDGMVGGGVAARFAGTDPASAQAWWSRLVEQLGPLGRHAIAFGSFPFDPGHSTASATLVLPRWVVVRKGGGCRRIEVRGEAPEEFHADQGSPAAMAPAPDRGEWESRVDKAIDTIRSGALQKVVLARAEDRALGRPVRELVTRLHERHPKCWSFLVDGLVGASPEMLVRREGGLITSRVLAGTVRRSGDSALLAATLAESAKDLAEHEFAVASVARALAPWCSALNVPESPYVLSLPNVLHLATDVTGAAGGKDSVLTLVQALHPSAAVCGTPTEDARQLIRELESLDRGRYSGPVGWIDGTGDGSWAIALRCGQIEGDRIRLFAGCGIVADSVAIDEGIESEAKLVPMREALA